MRRCESSAYTVTMSCAGGGPPPQIAGKKFRVSETVQPILALAPVALAFYALTKPVIGLWGIDYAFGRTVLNCSNELCMSAVVPELRMTTGISANKAIIVGSARSAVFRCFDHTKVLKGQFILSTSDCAHNHQECR